MRRRRTAAEPVSALLAKSRSRLLRKDVLRLGASGLKSRPTRVVLSALGIAIGIAAMIAVVGISTSSQARLNEQLSSLGTNMLTVGAGKSMFGDQSKLPETAAGQVSRIDGVEKTAWLAELEGVKSYRSRLIDPGQSGGITGAAVSDNLLDVTEASMKAGTWFTSATANYPTVVLGAKAAQRLGVVTPGTQVWIGDQLFTVLGVLDPVPLAPELDTMAMFSEHTAIEAFGWEKNPTTIYERSSDEAVDAIRDLLPRAVNPQNPEEVEVSRPSDALAAKNAADTAFTGLLVGLGSVALLVGGIGVANTMVISVLERRREIGLRRALGATRKHIRSQFLAEALLLSALGGVAGVGIGMVVITVFANANGWPVSVPPLVILSGVAATIVIGAIAGLYPAIRAARTPPTAALAS
ncbi:putative ABC transport system permease protein [Mycetocola sp. BIGb0189]|uniref:ABC transporter permease n=1 Tax=Mycetocola sp. BIGb0189 TaxID=2940604 RepID=UPI002169DC6E|nr:ABC transporter permease [Mycetocola sp. BIGb0189]MCS4275650.1 putative ABC transport system permease protein [Mycetocola sp. BIGb0189]